MTTTNQDSTLPQAIAPDGPGFLKSILWAAAVVLVASVSLGALWNNAEARGPGIAAR